MTAVTERVTTVTVSDSRNRDNDSSYRVMAVTETVTAVNE